MVQVLKVYIPSRSGIPDIRRLTVSSSTLNSHSQLVEKIVVAVPKLAGKCFELFWKDFDGDDITITDDNDLAQAVANLEDVLKIYIRFNDVDNVDTSTKNSALDEHNYVKCDGCNKGLVGFRYKCLQCYDFDLCADCNAAGKHPYHDMIKLVSPCNYPRQWLFVGWKNFYKSVFGIEPENNLVDRSQSRRRGSSSSSSRCPYITAMNLQKLEKEKEKSKVAATPKVEKKDLNVAPDSSTKKSESTPSTSKDATKKNESTSSTSEASSEEKNKDFPPGFPFHPEFLHPGLNPDFYPGCGDNAGRDIPENVRNLIAKNAVPVCKMINNFLKPFGADLRIEVETPSANPNGEKDEKPKEETTDKATKATSSQSERVVPIEVEAASASSVKLDGAQPKSKSPDLEKPLPPMSHGLFTHFFDPKAPSFPNGEEVKKPTNEHTGINFSKKEAAVDATSQEQLSVNAEGWTVITPPSEKDDISLYGSSANEVKYPSLDEITIPSKANSTEVKHPLVEEITTSTCSSIGDTEAKYTVEEVSNAEPKLVSAPEDEVEDISKLDPEIANSLLKMRAMGFTNEGGWLLRLLQAKKGNIYHALDSLYPNQTQHQ